MKITDLEITSDRYKQYERAWKYAYDMTNKEIHQAVEGLYHNLNTLQSRSGNQLPFTSINYGTCTLESGRMFTRALLDVSIEGLGSKGVTSIFPCGIFQLKSGVNKEPGTPNYDLKQLALKSTSMRIYPNYVNCDWTVSNAWLKQDRQMKQEYIDSLDKKTYDNLVNMIQENKNVADEKLGLYVDDNKVKVDLTERPIELFNTMGSRTINGLDINALDNFKENVKHFIDNEFDKIDDIFSGAQKDGRGNICPVTIIFPTLAAMAVKKITAKYGDENPSSEEHTQMIWDEFMRLLDKKLHEAKDALLERFNHIASQSPASAKFMYENHTMAGYHENEGIISALKHGTIVIGQLGVAAAFRKILFDAGDHRRKKIGAVKVAFEKLPQVSIKSAEGYVLNPMGYNLMFATASGILAGLNGRRSPV